MKTDSVDIELLFSLQLLREVGSLNHKLGENNISYGAGSGKKYWIYSGDDFLFDYSAKQLTGIYAKEKDPKAKVRLLAAIKRKEGGNLIDISKDIKHPLTTVGDWLRRMHTEGLDRRYNIKRSGRPKRLTEEEADELQRILSGSPREQNLPFVIWTTKLVCYFIEQKYGIKYKTRQTRNILHKMSMSLQKPRPSHRKANKLLQESFKKTSEKQPDPSLMTDMRSYFWTRASLQ